MTRKIIVLLCCFVLTLQANKTPEQSIDLQDHPSTPAISKPLVRAAVAQYLNFRRTINPLIINGVLSMVNNKNVYVAEAAHALVNGASHVAAHKYLDPTKDTAKLIKGGVVFAAGETAISRLSVYLDNKLERYCPTFKLYSPISSTRNRLDIIANAIRYGKECYNQQLKQKLFNEARFSLGANRTTNLSDFVKKQLNVLRINATSTQSSMTPMGLPQSEPDFSALAVFFNQMASSKPQQPIIDGARDTAQQLFQVQAGIVDEIKNGLTTFAKVLTLSKISGQIDWAIEYAQQ